MGKWNCEQKGAKDAESSNPMEKDVTDGLTQQATGF